jgi:hypothetical protein
MVEMYNDLNLTDATVTTSGDDVLLIRSPLWMKPKFKRSSDAMEQRFNDTVTLRRSDSVGPTIGRK